MAFLFVVCLLKLCEVINYSKGVKANDAYELAEEAVKKSIEARTKKPAPRNSKVIDYLQLVHKHH